MIPDPIATHYGKTKITKLQAAKNELRAAIAAEGTERVQAAWDRAEPWIDRIFTTGGDATTSEE